MGKFFKIQKLDIFGSKFNYYIKPSKQKRLKTAFGGFQTFIFLLTTILALTIFGRKLADKKRPEVSVNTNVAIRDHPYDLYHNNFYVNFGMFDGAIFPKTEQTRKYFTIRGQRETTYIQTHPSEPPETTKTPKRAQNGQKPKKVKNRDSSEKRTLIEPFDVIKCENLSNNYTDITSEAYAQDKGEYYRGSVFCGNLIFVKHWWLQGSKDELPYTRIRYKVYPCTLEDPGDCAGAQDLAASQLLIPVYTFSANFSNWTTPQTSGLDADLTSLFSVITKTKLVIWIRETTILDDYIDFFRNFGPRNQSVEIEKVTSTIGTRDGSLHCTQNQMEDGVCDPYVEIEVRASKTQTIVERRYYKFLTMVSEVGGFGDLIFIALAFLAQFWGGCYRVKWIRERLYGGLMEGSLGVGEGALGGFGVVGAGEGVGGEGGGGGVRKSDIGSELGGFGFGGGRRGGWCRNNQESLKMSRNFRKKKKNSIFSKLKNLVKKRKKGGRLGAQRLKKGLNVLRGPQNVLETEGFSLLRQSQNLQEGVSSQRQRLKTPPNRLQSSQTKLENSPEIKISKKSKN